MAGDVVGSIGLARTGGDSPLPVYSGSQMSQAFAAYKQLQDALDKAMPDAIMELDGKKFRKKNYWRGVAVAFNLTVETVEERREIAGVFKDGRENFGYVVSKRATAPNGRTVMSDGTCFAVEKARRFKCPHLKPGSDRYTVHFPHSMCPDFDPEFQWRTLPGDATEHNVRGHASTRAFNRAVSDLVGFGEVSAEEVQHEGGDTQEAKPVGGGKTPSAASESAPAQPSAPVAGGTTKVKKVTTKTGKKKDGSEWVRYRVDFEDGRTGGTFDKKLGAACQEAEKSGEPVNPQIEAGEKGNDLMALQPILAERPLEPEVVRAADDPVEGPEKVLTARKITRQDGSVYYVIQTAKRELYSDVKAHADEAVLARRGGFGVVPSFTVGPWPGVDRPVNHLQKLLVEHSEVSEEIGSEREPGADG